MPTHPLRPEAERQWLLAVAVCEAMAHTYRQSGVDFALSAFRPPGTWLNCWAQLDAMSPLIVVLLPSVDTLVLRDAARVGRSHVGEANVRRNHATYDWHAWRSDPRALVIDNSELSVAEVVSRVETEVIQRIRPTN